MRGASGVSLGRMRGETDNWVTLAADSIVTAIVRDAAEKDFFGPFTLDDFLRAWLEHDAELVDMLPEPPKRADSSTTQTRTYWFYEGCRALEQSARIAEVGDGKFVVAALNTLVAQVRQAELEGEAQGEVEGADPAPDRARPTGTSLADR